MAVLKQAKLRKDVFHPFLLRFRDATIEKVFLNEHAIAHRRIVYIGYFLQLVFGTVGIVVAQLIGTTIKVEQCVMIQNAAMEVLCQQMLGNRDIRPSDVQALKEGELMSESSISIKRMRKKKVTTNTDFSILLLDGSALAQTLLQYHVEDPDLWDGLGDRNGTTGDEEQWAPGMTFQKTIDGRSSVAQVAAIAWTMIIVLLGTFIHWRIQDAGTCRSCRPWSNERHSSEAEPREATTWQTPIAKLKSLFKFPEKEDKSAATICLCILYTVQLVGK